MKTAIRGPLFLLLGALSACSSGGGAGGGGSSASVGGGTSTSSTSTSASSSTHATATGTVGSGGGGGAGGQGGATAATGSSSNSDGTAGVGGASSSSGSATTVGSSASSGSGVGGGAGGSSGAGGGPGGLCGDCPAGTKPASDVRCVPNDDPRYGCAAPGATPCAGPHTTGWTCSAGACAPSGCQPGWADCNGDPSDGCESDLTSPTTCGDCANPCTLGDVCTPGGCAASCTPPLTDCSGSCANLVTSPEHCGGCTNVCPSDEIGTAACSNATCGFTCPPGLTVMGGRCVDESSDPTCCGATCTPCSVWAGESACVGGLCSAYCWPGYTACLLPPMGPPYDGPNVVCTNLETNASNCGACGHTCAATESCVNHVCDPSTAPSLASAQSPDWLVGDAASLYWIDGGTNIKSVGKNGGVVTTVASNEAGPIALALDADYVYWTARLGGAVRRAPKAGGPASVVVPATEPYYLAVDDAWVYWVDGSLTIFRATKTGSPSGQAIGAVAQLTPASFAIDANYLYRLVSQQAVTEKVQRGALDGTGTLEDVATWSSDGINYGFVRGIARTLTLRFGPVYVCRDDAPSNCSALGAPAPVTGDHGFADDGVFIYGAGTVPSGLSGAPGLAKALSCARLYEVLVYGGNADRGIVVDDAWVYYLDTSAVMRTPK